MVNMNYKTFLYALCMCIALSCTVDAATIRNLKSKTTLKAVTTSNGLRFSVEKDDIQDKLTGVLGNGINFMNLNCRDYENCKLDDNSSMSIIPIDNGFQITYESKNMSSVFEDCLDLRKGDVNWYGGPERWQANWPIEKLVLDGSKPYVLLRSDNFAVAESYWLNSKGSYVYIDRKTPLFVDQNNKLDGSVCFIAKAEAPYINRQRVLLNYTLIVMDNAKEAHLHAVNTFLNKPSGHPNETMIREPIWTTWAKYKKPISDDIVVSFAKDVVDHGFKGQLEIDDDWEVCYGAQEFKHDKFANISNTVQTLKDLGFRVTLWVHPFVNDDCQNNSQEGKDQGYFVKNTKGDVAADWWDGNDAHQIDFTNDNASNWYLDRLKKLQENPGIDSFKFDAGETDYANQPAVFTDGVDVELYPNILSEMYIRTCAQIGDLIEVRSASHTQDLPIFVRMLDKDSNWGNNNGLYTLITTLLQMNMNGYNMVLPDMVGGNGYNGAPTAELLARWTQANTFMPTMQFSYLPWEITSDDFDGLAIIKKYVDLHSQYADDILEAMNNSIDNGTPVNPPIWWIDPTNPDALKEDTEYLLGESILVAPVIVEGATSRDVYLPSGSWKDGNNGTVYTGPITIKDYPAPIEVLPYFIKQ